MTVQTLGLEGYLSRLPTEDALTFYEVLDDLSRKRGNGPYTTQVHTISHRDGSGTLIYHSPTEPNSGPRSELWVCASSEVALRVLLAAAQSETPAVLYLLGDCLQNDLRQELGARVCGSQTHMILRDSPIGEGSLESHSKLGESDSEICAAHESPKAGEYLYLATSQPDRYELFGTVEGGSLVTFCAVLRLRNPLLDLSEVAYIHTAAPQRGRGYARRLLSAVSR